MAVFNKILNILVFILAICAVVFGFFLFEKREELRFRGDKMAKMINSVSKTLDMNSGTDYAGKLIPQKLDIDLEKSGSVAKTNMEKSLYHDNYNNLSKVLAPFKVQADAVIEQRDILATTLTDSMKSLEAPQQDNYAETGFREIGTYANQTKLLLETTGKINARDNATFTQIVDSAGVIGFTMEAETLKNLDEYATPLGEFGTKVSALKTRSDTYAGHIKSVCDILQISSPALEGEDYADALATAKNAVQGVKDEFEQCKKDLKITKEKLAETEDKLNQEIEKVANLEEQVKKLEKRIVDLMGGDEDGPDAQSDDKDFLVKKLEGNVLKVNQKWDFVVIDLGKEAEKNKMMRGKKNPKEVIVSLPEGRVMDVSRDNKYLGQIKIIRVNDNCAIGDILPDNKQGSIEPGDKVFFARTPKAEEEGGDEGGADGQEAGGDAMMDEEE